MLVGTNPRRVAIVGGLRIPFVRGNGAYARVGNQEMLTATLRGMVERYDLQGRLVDEVAAGAVMKHSSQWNLTRESVLGSGLAAETPGLDLQRACGTSLEAAISLGNKIALGQIDCAIAAGVDTVSDPPVVYPKSFQQLLLRSYRGKTFGERVGPWFGLRLKSLMPVLPGVAEPRTGLSMGESTELMVKTWGITRAEQDAFAVESQRRADAALKACVFTDELVRVPLTDGTTFAKDEYPRSGTTLESVAKLKPAFKQDGTVTAANSSSISDGAAALVLMRRSTAERAGLAPLAVIAGHSTHAQEPGWFTTAPVGAIRKLFERKAQPGEEQHASLLERAKGRLMLARRAPVIPGRDRKADYAGHAGCGPELAATAGLCAGAPR